MVICSWSSIRPSTVLHRFTRVSFKWPPPSLWISHPFCVCVHVKWIFFCVCCQDGSDIPLLAVYFLPPSAFFFFFFPRGRCSLVHVFDRLSEEAKSLLVLSYHPLRHSFFSDLAFVWFAWMWLQFNNVYVLFLLKDVSFTIVWLPTQPHCSCITDHIKWLFSTPRLFYLAVDQIILSNLPPLPSIFDLKICDEMICFSVSFYLYFSVLI